jgi:hypothetical protein
MEFAIRSFFLLFLLIINVSFKGNNHVIYKPSDEIFPNPERGFCVQLGRNFTEDAVNSLRVENITVIQRIYLLENFIDTVISDSYLQVIQNDMNIARRAGIKFVLRFSYTNRQNGKDAPLEIIKIHLDQLKPVLVSNYDVIAYVEAGLIGAWGEWYYSTNNLNNTEDRRSVLFKLLSVLPEERMVVVRTPKYKMDIFNLNEKDWISPDSAFAETYRTRTGAHNDCFLAGADDMGTYTHDHIARDKAFLNMDNRYVPMGGETCAVFAPRSECPSALEEMAFIHFSILNNDYNKKVLSSWTCMDEVKRRLGYRFRLLNADFPVSLAPGNTMRINLNIKNDGFASPYNKRRCDLILREKLSGKQYRLSTGYDPRFWLPESTINLNIEAGIPPDLPLGSYEVLLHLGDPVAELTRRPEYSIRFANEGVWEEETGYNRLISTVVISGKGGDKYKGNQWFSVDTIN